MPVYVVEFETQLGPERRPFTIDDDRPLQPQLVQVLEELRQSGRVLEGGPDDVLVASWNGADLDLAKSASAINLTADRPIVLRMGPRAAPPPPVVVRAREVDWTRVVLPVIEGALGAMVAWFLSWGLADLRGPFRTAGQVDLTVSVLLSLGVAVVIAIGAARRRVMPGARAALWCVLAPLAGLATAAATRLVGSAPSSTAFLGGRVMTWVLIAILVASPAAALLSSRAVASVGGTALRAAVAGAMGALVLSLPGPTLLLQALAFIVLGAGVGFAAIGSPMWREQVKTA